MFRTIKEEIETSITEKKSKFICHAYHVESVEEAEYILNSVRKKYHDARHNCYAYKIFDGEISKASDDGEPSGTAGVPMMNILNGRNLSNILVIVTRYFGGILLGTGGLVRAYSFATTTALDKANIVAQVLGEEAKFSVGYKELEELKYHLKNRDINISNIEYGEKIILTVTGKEESINRLINEKLSDRIMLEDIKIIGKKYISVEEK